MQTTPILEATNLTVGYGQIPVLAGINASVQQGKLLCLLGPNGVGKSTLLRTLSGVQPALKGEVHLNGTPINALQGQSLARQLGVVLTDRPDVGQLSAYGLAALGRHPYTGWLGHLSADDHQVIRDALNAVGASHLAGQMVNELSDGQRQKIMLARALAQEPSLIILDEPTAFLDLPHRVEILRLLRDLAHAQGRAVLLSTHDLSLALQYADLIWLMPPGKSLDIGLPEDLALNGALKRTFPAFDDETGGFVVPEAHGQKTVQLIGQPNTPAYFWTKHALQRAEYSLVNDSSHVVVVTEQGWQVNGHNAESVEDLLDLLTSLFVKGDLHVPQYQDTL